MKTAEEVAYDFLYAHGHNPIWGLKASAKALEKRLTTFAEERTQENLSAYIAQYVAGRMIALDEAIQWTRAEARDCGCAERIEKHLSITKYKPAHKPKETKHATD